MIFENSALETQPAQPDGVTNVYLDITDLILYAEAGNVTVSGIQRVIVNLVAHRHLSRHAVRPVLLAGAAQEVMLVGLAEILALVEHFQSGGTDKRQVKWLAEQVRRSTSICLPKQGDAFVIPGAFWIYPNHRFLADLRKRGVAVSVFVHDLIQINSPEYVSADANLKFKKAFLDVLSPSTMVVTNSNYVRDDVVHYVEDRLGFQLPVVAVQLPTEMPVRQLVGNELPLYLAQTGESDFVLCVATIEVRKNHAYLIEIWERLIASAEFSVPNLVFVGKWGWQIEELRAHIDATNAIGDWLHIFNDLSDAGLHYLYSKALFTAYPSFAEGWGLPVGESLAYGTPCVASNTTSIPEVGGRFARYFDPYDVNSGYHLIASLLADRSAISAWASDIRANFHVKTWSLYCKEFYAAVSNHLADGVVWPLLGNYTYSSGKMYIFGDSDLELLDTRGDMLINARPSLGDGWGQIGAHEVRSISQIAKLSLQTNLVPGTNVAAYLLLRAHPDCPALAVDVDCGAGVIKLGKLPNGFALFRVLGLISDNRTLDVELKGCNKLSNSEDRLLGVGLGGVAFSAPDDVTARLELHEVTMQMLAQLPSRHILEDEEPLRLRGAAAVGIFLIRLFGGACDEVILRRGYLRRLTFMLKLRRARTHARAGNWKQAEASYAGLLRTWWELPELWTQYGHAIKEQQDYNRALVSYSIASTFDVGNAELREHIAFCTNQLDAALTRRNSGINSK